MDKCVPTILHRSLPTCGADHGLIKGKAVLSAPLASLVFIHMPCCPLTKVFATYVVTFLSWTPIFEWYITRLVDKERQQEDIWDGEIGLYAQNIDNIFSPIVNIIGWVYMSISRERDLFILTSFDLFHNFNFNMTVCVLTKWPDSTVQFFVELKMPRIGLYSSYERGPFRGFEHASVRGGVVVTIANSEYENHLKFSMMKKRHV